MKNSIFMLAASIAPFLAQPATAAQVTLAFEGVIGPLTTPAVLGGGSFDGAISFDDAKPFPAMPAVLSLTNGQLAGDYAFGAAPGSFVPASYRVTYSDTAFRFVGIGDDGASLAFDLMGTGAGAYSGSFAFVKGTAFSAVGDVTVNTSATTPVPETAAWLMMIVGMGMIGAALRRRSGRVIPHSAAPDQRVIQRFWRSVSVEVVATGKRLQGLSIWAGTALTVHVQHKRSRMPNLNKCPLL